MFGIASLAGLASLGYGATFAIGAAAGVLTYSFDRVVVGATGGGWHWDPVEALIAGGLGGLFAVGGKWIGSNVPRLRAWWNQNVHGLRNGAQLGSERVEWAVSKWMGRGRWALDWADEGGFQVSRNWGRFRVQARFESWGRGGLDPPHLNLELWNTRGPAPAQIHNNHIYFYDIGA